MTQEMKNPMEKQLDDQEVQNVTGGYTSTDHYKTTNLPSPMTCSVCGGLIYTITANNYGPNRVLKSVTYHCSGNGYRGPHDVVETYF